jgi:hypothetical protein
MKHLLFVFAAGITGCHCDGASVRATAPPSATGISTATPPSSTVRDAGAPTAWSPSPPFRDLAMTMGETCIADSLGEVGCILQAKRRWRPLRAGGPIERLALGAGELCAVSSGELSCGAVGGAALIRKLDGVADVAMAEHAGCARGLDGGVRCWNGGGPVAVIAGVDSATAIGVLSGMACAIVAGGSIRCWSAGTTRAESLNGIEHAEEIGCSKGYCCARSRGTIQCWTAYDWREVGPKKSIVEREKHISDAQLIAVGSSHICAELADGGVVCWGEGQELGAIGERCPALPGTCASLTTCQRECTTPIRIDGVSDVVRLVAASGTCALRASGPPLCWGGWSAYGAPGSAREPVEFTW